ncbi:sce7726 family protein [Pedobacter sp. JY14-1]|uniref:sce7726 family protein n=1 Tax=Pedobacter sp. JY14-1 TaxID=3034151 RepID=UPI0023E20D48|nr:sce7726 family protein [Pedobacter sp. JY14-1]
MNNKHRNLGSDKASALARSYSPLLYFSRLKQLIQSVNPEVDLSSFNKYQLHSHINSILLGNYSGEEVIKYQIAKKYLNIDTIGGFELKVRNSRADFVSINGVSKCYEIKTQLDNLSKLPKQVVDYKAVFEYNSIILDKKHLPEALNILPQTFGIYSIEKGRLKTLRQPTKNTDLCSKSQLGLLTVKELKNYFGSSRDEIDDLLKHLKPTTINKVFKTILKARYAQRWNFLKTHQHQILPIDFQFFFSTQESPSLLYQKDF